MAGALGAAPRAAESANGASAADVAMARGAEANERGDFERAVLSWAEAATLYGEAGQGRAQVRALLRLSEAQQAIGEYREAEGNLISAKSIVEGTEDKLQLASVLGALGNV